MDILDILFPKSCVICSKHGDYLCNRCKKLFKKSLPECYICRKISPNYLTHKKCAKISSLDSVAVLWEYNELSSTVLKKYKYGGVLDIEDTFLELIEKRLSEIKESIILGSKTLVSPVPISKNRLRERGFNQTEKIAKMISKETNRPLMIDLVMRKNSDSIHQSLLSKEERLFHKEGFFIPNGNLLKGITDILVIDDVITTGSTLEQITKCIKEVDPKISVKSICIFRGKPFYKKEREARSLPLNQRN